MRNEIDQAFGIKEVDKTMNEMSKKMLGQDDVTDAIKDIADKTINLNAKENKSALRKISELSKDDDNFFYTMIVDFLDYNKILLDSEAVNNLADKVKAIGLLPVEGGVRDKAIATLKDMLAIALGYEKSHEFLKIELKNLSINNKNSTSITYSNDKENSNSIKKQIEKFQGDNIKFDVLCTKSIVNEKLESNEKIIGKFNNFSYNLKEKSLIGNKHLYITNFGVE